MQWLINALVSVVAERNFYVLKAVVFNVDIIMIGKMFAMANIYAGMIQYNAFE